MGPNLGPLEYIKIPVTYKQSGCNNADQRCQFVGYSVGIVRVTNTLVVTEESSSEWLEPQCVVG